MPQFSGDYVRPYVNTWTRLFRELEWDAGTPKSIVEIGSYEGSSALWFAENLLRHRDSVLYCLDSWEVPKFHEQFLKNIAGYRGLARIVPMKMYSDKALMQLIGQGIVADLVYIDGDHRAPGVLSDLVLSFKLLRVGGLMICDDYTWADPRHGGAELVGRPKLAIDAFTSIHSNKIRIIHRMPIVQVAFVKLAD